MNGRGVDIQDTCALDLPAQPRGCSKCDSMSYTVVVLSNETWTLQELDGQFEITDSDYLESTDPEEYPIQCRHCFAPWDGDTVDSWPITPAVQERAS